MKTTKLTCPKCGTEFEIPQHEHITVGIAIGRDSNLGEIHPKVAGEGNKNNEIRKPLSPASKAEDRLAALAAAGIDTTGIFAMKSAAGKQILAKMDGNNLSIIPDDDPIFNAIKTGGTIPERRLFRRWVMSQMFHMLGDKKGNKFDFSEMLARKGYQYSWKMMLEELRVQARLYDNCDRENFEQRNRWFNREVAVAMAEDYIEKFRAYTRTLKVQRCKGVPYITIKHRNIFVSDVEKKLIRPLQSCLADIKKTTTPGGLYLAVKAFDNNRPAKLYNVNKCKAWNDAYKGSGAYYTLKNLILFHGCTDSKHGYKDTESTLAHVEGLAEKYRYEGWRMLAYLKRFITDNGIDIAAKMRNWNS